MLKAPMLDDQCAATPYKVTNAFSDFIFPEWYPSEPSINTNEHCLELWPSGFLNDKSCDGLLTVVCELNDVSDIHEIVTEQPTTSEYQTDQTTSILTTQQNVTGMLCKMPTIIT